jgi:hypothetical protein
MGSTLKKMLIKKVIELVTFFKKWDLCNLQLKFKILLSFNVGVLSLDEISMDLKLGISIK